MNVDIDPPSPLPPGITIRTPPPVSPSPSPTMSFNTSRSREESTTSIQPQGAFLSSEFSIVRKGNMNLCDGQMFIQQSHLLKPPTNNPLPCNCYPLSDCLKAQMMLHLPGLPIWNFSNALVGKSASLYSEVISNINLLSQYFYVLSYCLSSPSCWDHHFRVNCFLVGMTKCPELVQKPIQKYVTDGV